LKEAQPGYYEVHEITGNYHLTSFQAALGLSQLRRLDDLIDKRRRLVERYRSRLSQHQHVKLFSDALIGKTVFHLFVIQIDFQACDVTRSVLMEKLRERGIGTEVHYIPLYYHPALHRDEWVEKEKCAETDAYYQQTLSLPLYVDLSEEDVDWICSELLSLIT
jgi:dTDP-4-amino-4,6-dideoxygalactose transaminase